MGYKEGHFYRWFSRFNESRQLMLEQPSCHGGESHVRYCSGWQERKIGSGICDYHADIGIQCDRHTHSSSMHWAGIKFDEAEYQEEYLYSFEGKMKRKVSLSKLTNVDIVYAGSPATSFAAVEVLGIPPQIKSTTIMYSLSSGINITNVNDAFVIDDSTFVENNGHGIFVNSSWGQVNLRGVRVEHNAADGIRYNLQEDLQTGDNFCHFSNLGDNQVYPVRITHDQKSNYKSSTPCCQEFRIRNYRGNEARLTAHFTHIVSGIFEGPEDERAASADGWIEVHDGFKNTLVSRFILKNDTKVPSVTSSASLLRICYHPAILKKVLFTVVVVADFGRAYDLNVTSSIITNNNGRGIWIENQRTGTVVNHTTVANNSYVAGVHLFSQLSPLGDFIVNNSRILNNKGDGVNITLQGVGYFHVDRSEVRFNEHQAIALWLNETIVRDFNQYAFFYSSLTYSLIDSNGGIGFLHGNVCHSAASINISMNHIHSNLNGIEIHSCTKNSPDVKLLKFLINNNQMSSNKRLAIKMSTIARINEGIISHNTFTGHSKGVIYINSQEDIFDDSYFESLPVNIAISDNVFTANRGLFVVNIGVQDNSHNQVIYFTRNKLHDNHIVQPHPTLNPRSRVAAVVVVSSSNTIVTKNNMVNPLSEFEIGTHLESHSRIINASLNYFGSLSNQGQTLLIYERIFDRKNRYNLAQVEFLQYRTSEVDFETLTMLSLDRERDKIMPFRQAQKIGGEVSGDILLEAGTFEVAKDIFIRPGSRLRISSGALLIFQQSIGMMVQGKLECLGSPRYPILLTASERTVNPFTASGVPSNVPSLSLDISRDITSRHDNQTDLTSLVNRVDDSNDLSYVTTVDSTSLDSLVNSKSHFKDVPSEPTNSSVNIFSNSVHTAAAATLLSSQSHRHKRQVSASTLIRLVQSRSNTIGEKGIEGRLEVFVDDRWGGVCSYGFDILDASIACQQMGLALNSHDWLLEKSQYYSDSSNILLSNVKCSHLDTDITQCESEKSSKNDFFASCTTDVAIKCYRPTWAGIRLGMAAESSVIEHTIIEKAGLLDYTTSTFKPALQIDFNHHKIYNLTSQENSDSGLGFMWHDIFTQDTNNLKVKGGQFSSNGNNGITTHSQGLKVVNCLFKNNRASGFNYDPVFTRKEQLDLISWVTGIDDSAFITIPPSSVRSGRLLQDNHIHLDPSKRSSWFIHVKRNPQANFNYSFSLSTEVGHGLGVMVLNPVFSDATDNLTISNFAMNLHWDLRRNLSSFPMLQSAFKLSLTYTSGSRPHGNILLYVSVRNLQVRDRVDLSRWQEIENRNLKTILIDKCFFSQNGRGISSHHYNRDIGTYDEYYHRYSNESILVTGNVIESSRKEAFFVNSPLYDPHQISLAEINFTLVNNSILYNNRGIVQFSRDIRSSNNLFHWTINQTIVTNSDGTALLIRLPYVWQFNENYTHSVSINHNTFNRNDNFEFLIDGHFTKLNVTYNTFTNNLCQDGLIKISGMEKAILFAHNTIENNQGHFMLVFDIQSHADKFGSVPADVFMNSIRYNKDILVDFSSSSDNLYQPKSYTLALKGVQFINITRNLLHNPNLQYEFLAAAITGSLDSRLNVTRNWWGTSVAREIRNNRIFDFDKWNSYAIADYNPFLIDEYFTAAEFKVTDDTRPLESGRELGGLIFKDLFLWKRDTPYKVRRDLTIMPGATLHINAGVEMEFFPSIGILVLGDMIVAGTDTRPVIMRPDTESEANSVYRYKRQDSIYSSGKIDPSDITNVRLCHTSSCKEWNPNSKMNHGFLEVFNVTTKQWVAICDGRFTERNAQVVCGQLNHSKLNVHVRHGRRFDMGLLQVSQVKYWPEPFRCSGAEPSVSKCDLRLNGYGNHSNSCSFDSESFVYIYCGSETLASQRQYWGGLRFARESYEHEPLTYGRETSLTASSRLQHLHIIGAGILHNEKSAAIQMVNREVSLELVNISQCASHGVEAISPVSHLRFNKVNIHHNLGSGINYLILGDALSEAKNEPLKELTLPYNVYSFVDICDINKNMFLKQKILVYYKYDNRPVDCVKIFKTSPNQQILFRLLQFNLFNSTDYSAITDSLEIFDGDVFNSTTRRLAEFGVTERHRLDNSVKQLFTSSRESLSMRLHASAASQEYGFIAEVVLSDYAPHDRNKFDHNVTFSDISRNLQGAIQYRYVGRPSPNINILFNRFTDNCIQLYGNFTSCSSALDLKLQNSQSVTNFFFINNLLANNQGGLKLQASAFSSTSLIRNNLFQSNYNNGVLHIKGPEKRDSTYHYADVFNNYFTQNISPYVSNILLSHGVTANLTKNTITTNHGKHQLEVVGFDHAPISHQIIDGNWFYNNYARYYNERATVFASAAGQNYTDNYFVNPDNDFELATVNRSHFFAYSSDPKQIEQERQLSIDAKLNWWGFNESSAINSRIYDFNDHPDFIRVKFIPFHSANSSVLSGICSGGWEKIGRTCFMFIGARMSFAAAKQFCESQNATMPIIKANEYQLTRYLSQQQFGYDFRFFKVWVASYDHECPVLYYNRVEGNSCDDQLAFLCEKDPDIRVELIVWWRTPLGILALVISLFTALLMLCCSLCSLCKSREKAKEKLQRRNSIRASIRSNRSFHASSTASSLNEIAYKRQGFMSDPAGPQSSLHQPIQLSNFASIYGVHSRSRSSSLDSFSGRVDPPHLSMQSPSERQSSFDPLPDRFNSHHSLSYQPPYEDRFADDPALENANVDLIVRPTFDLTYENRAFRETPSASRASNVEYSEARDWSTIGRNSTLQPPVPARRQAIPVAIPKQPQRSVSPSSIGQFSRPSPTPTPLLPQANTYEPARSNYERLPQQDMLTFTPARMVKSSSITSLINTAASDVTTATNLTGITSRTKQSQYLETSLDGDSVVYDYCDYPAPTAKPGDSVSMASAAHSRAQPLETAM